MDYFVSLENIPSHHWQAELLIESFKYHGLEDRLVVALAAADQPGFQHYCRNLYSHKRIFLHENTGQVRGYDRFNRLASLDLALRTETVRQPVTVLELDVVLFKPVEIPKADYPHVVFQVDPLFSPELAREHIPSLDPYFPRGMDGRWLPLGGTFYLNNIPHGFIERSLLIAELMAFDQVRAGKNIWSFTDRAAWAANLSELVGAGKVEGVYDLEMVMPDRQSEHNLVNYERGFPPTFTKRMFRYRPGDNLFALGDPLETIAQCGSTPASNFMVEMAQRCLAARGKTK